MSIADMIIPILFGLVADFLGYAYIAIRPLPPKTCGSPGGPPVTSPRVKLHDGRYLAYKEKGVAKEKAKHKIIVSHGFGDSKDFYLPISEELMKQYSIYIVQYDRAGYGESDPNPLRSVKSEAFDIQELADELGLGPRFYLIGISLGAYGVYSCLRYTPHRIKGAALVAPAIQFWWDGFPSELLNEAFDALRPRFRWTFRFARYVPWLLNWWMNQKLFPNSSILGGKPDHLAQCDLDMIRETASINVQEKVRQQGDHECLHRDLIVGFGNWGFELKDISNPFPGNEIRVHIWQGREDKLVFYKANRYIAELLPWIQYHEISDAGHMLIYKAANCEAIFKSLVAS